MRFEDVIGQQDVKNQLAGLVQNNRLSHALLFLGKEGNGALPLAIALAQYLVCEKVSQQSSANSQQSNPSLFGEEPVVHQTDTSPVSDSCGVCPSCVRSAKLIHPDIHFSYPTVTKKPGEKPIATDFITEWRQFIEETPYGNLFDWTEAIKEKENSQAKITAAECNDIIHKLNLKSFESGYKTLVMWIPELMGKEGNILLKLIEEPPADTLFILVTENESLLLPTIVSRCQLIPIPSLTTNDIEEALVKTKKTDPVIARQVAGTSEGNYRDALLSLDDAEED
ncbi:MAG TPA: hypothetical protein VLJ68_01705, partial [Chitinophagaceae bacterium]|nr:hypothetical protein [Chitinophagaceae bacterium]